MKYIKFLMTMCAAAFAFVGCTADIEQRQLVSEEEFTAPVLAEVGDILVDGDHKNETVVFNCTPARFGQPVQIRYVVTLALGGKTTDLAMSYTPSISVTKNDINGAVVNGLEVAANESAEVGAYVTAYVGDSDIHSAPSNTVYFNVATYKASLRTIQLVGDFCNWGNDGMSPVAMWETDGGTNVYSGIYDLTGSNGQFKFLTPDWTGYDKFDSVSSGVEDVDGDNHNFQVTPGAYRITVNMSAKSVEVVSVPNLVIIGGWDGWAVAITMVYDSESNVWTSQDPVDTAGSDVKYLFRLNDDWTAKLGGGTELGENLPEGVSEAYQLVDGGADIDMPAGKWYVKLYADRTPCLVEYVAAE
ncbi:MAG: SusE domain-containing protein [Alistipes sp.]|nr:SusE domain-containing protein [Alistipes sp.]